MHWWHLATPFGIPLNNEVTNMTQKYIAPMAELTLFIPKQNLSIVWEDVSTEQPGPLEPEKYLSGDVVVTIK